MVAGVHGEEGVACGCGYIGIGGSLQMIGIGAEAVPPALLEDAPHRVIHHFLRRAAGAGILADALLRKDRCDPPGFANRANVSRCGQAEPVATAR